MSLFPLTLSFWFRLSAAALGLALLLMPGRLYAHGDDILSQVVADYTIEVLPPAGDLKPGVPSNFTLVIEAPAAKTPLANVPVWLRFSQGDEVIFASGHFQTDASGQAQLSIVFPEEANYELSAAFKVDGQEYRADFGLPVGNPGRIHESWEDALAWPVVLAGLIGLGFGFLIRVAQKRL